MQAFAPHAAVPRLSKDVARRGVRGPVVGGYPPTTPVILSSSTDAAQRVGNHLSSMVRQARHDLGNSEPQGKRPTTTNPVILSPSKDAALRMGNHLVSRVRQAHHDDVGNSKPQAAEATPPTPVILSLSKDAARRVGRTTHAVCA